MESIPKELFRYNLATIIILKLKVAAILWKEVRD